MKYIEDYVKGNKEVIDFVQNAVPGAVDKYIIFKGSTPLYD